MRQKRQYSSRNYSKYNWIGYFKSFSKIFLIALVITICIQGFKYSKEYYHTYISFEHNFFQKSDILATSTGPEQVTVDFSKQISTGSPLIFGGAHMPNLEHQDAWNKIEDVGVTIIRRDIFIENELPQGITLQDYKNNVNDIQNPDNWNQDSINFTNSVYKNAKDRGIKIMAIMSYAPAWLTYSGNSHGVPKDWNVFEDIVKKSYKLHASYIDYIEIWNEPTLPQFLDTTGSSLSSQEAYDQIYYHAYKAIREAENELNESKSPIGASVGHDPIDTSHLELIFKNPLTEDSLDFVSYHNYEAVPEPSWDDYKKILKEYKKENIPLYLTEWNYSGGKEENVYYRSGTGAITYTADKFVEYLRMGLKMSNYYALVDVNRPKYENDDPSYGFYKWENGIAELLPQAKTWRLLSRTLRLGEGNSRIFDAKVENDEINSVGFINSNKDTGIILVNKSDSDTYVTVNIKNINSDNKGVPFYVYIASDKYNGSEIVDRFYLPKNKDNVYQVTILVPAQSAEALFVPQDYDWKDTIRSYLP